MHNCGFEKSWGRKGWAFGYVLECTRWWVVMNTLFICVSILIKTQGNELQFHEVDRYKLGRRTNCWGVNLMKRIKWIFHTQEHFQQQGEMSTRWICTKQRNPSFTRIMSWYFVSMNHNISKTKFHKIFEINLNFCLYKCIENATICTTKGCYFLVVQIAIEITFICNVGGFLCPPIAFTPAWDPLPFFIA